MKKCIIEKTYLKKINEEKLDITFNSILEQELDKKYSNRRYTTQGTKLMIYILYLKI